MWKERKKDEERIMASLVANMSLSARARTTSNHAPNLILHELNWSERSACARTLCVRTHALPDVLTTKLGVILFSFFVVLFSFHELFACLS